ncbi:MAG: galactokinase [Chloroflexia bacterium]
MTRTDSSPRLEEAFRRHFGALPEVVAFAPGRVNLIGEHTDYNEGWVLPAALDLGTLVAARKRPDGRLRMVALRLAASDEAALAELRPPGGPGWSRYIRGVAALLVEAGCVISGADLLIDGDLPLEAGLSSSASLELGVALALASLAGCSIEPRALARLCRRAENEFAGVPCGIMDQMAVALGRAGHALLLDCRTLEIEPVPFPPEARLLIVDSGVPRALAVSAYRKRRAECEEATRLLQAAYPQVRALRDVTLEMLAGVKGLPETLRRRARHVVSENRRVRESVSALRAGDLETFGRLMDASHESLRHDFEVSGPELDLLVESACRMPGVFGARLTGAGFGGSIIALAVAEQAGPAAEAVLEAYRRKGGREGRAWVCTPAEGARLLER